MCAAIAGIGLAGMGIAVLGLLCKVVSLRGDVEELNKQIGQQIAINAAQATINRNFITSIDNIVKSQQALV